MNATRFSSLTAAVIAAALLAACAADRDDNAMARPAPVTPVAAAPVVQPAETLSAERTEPEPMASYAADPAVTAAPPVLAATSANPKMYENMVIEREPRADRN